MPKRVTVSPAEQAAARLIVKRAGERGRPVDPAVVKIAEATPRTTTTSRRPAAG